jgi:hypothetical protein
MITLYLHVVMEMVKMSDEKMRLSLNVLLMEGCL